MIQIDASFVAIFVTVLLSLITMGAAWGSLREKVKNNREEIDEHYRQNREDHQLIFNKLDSIQRDVRNGYKNPGS